MRGSCVAIIPARGGSKGLPGKNLRTVGGVPLVARAVRTAAAARAVERVIVSTDADDIAATALAAGAEVVRRPTPLATDESPSELALLHALDVLREREGYRPELVCFLQCTSPFTHPGDVDAAVARLHSEDADSLFTACAFHGFVWRPGEDGAWSGVNHHPGVRPMRQQRTPEYVETGAFYLCREAGLRAARHRFFGRVAMQPVPAGRALEIDSEEDLRLAEAIALVLPG